MNMQFEIKLLISYIDETPTDENMHRRTNLEETNPTTASLSATDLN